MHNNIWFGKDQGDNDRIEDCLFIKEDANFQDSSYGIYDSIGTLDFATINKDFSALCMYVE